MPSDKELLEVARTHAVIPDGHATILDRATVLRVLRAVALRFPADASESAALSPERVHEMWRAALAEGPEATTPMRFASAIERELRSTAGVALPYAPPGWKLVPVEPTEEMAYRGGEATAGRIEWDDAPDDAPDQLARAIYRAMLNAAPPGVPTPSPDQGESHG